MNGGAVLGSNGWLVAPMIIIILLFTTVYIGIATARRILLEDTSKYVPIEAQIAGIQSVEISILVTTTRVDSDLIRSQPRTYNVIRVLNRVIYINIL
jgi:hypothetical protein